MNSKLFDFDITSNEETGIVEYTDLTDIDRAMAKFWGNVLNSMTVTDTARKENREFVGFMKKPINEMLFVGQFDDPISFMHHVVAKRPDFKTMLPCCYLSRDPSIVYCDGSDYVDLIDFATITDSNGNVTANVSKSFLKLNYTITSLCWDKSTAGRIGLGLSMYLRRNKRNRPHTFKAKSMIAGTPVLLHIEINQPAMIMGTPIDISFSENRVTGNSFTIEVIAEVLEAKATKTTVNHVSVVTPSEFM
ncbi:hypothetical protein I3271_05420 [Photobacterium leiognathi]|uniref:hypothetical protein n=1 Tax=Photobacterium leiognathi TaxID=553611 RepID=UPI001EDE8216|nr:hypothetical protein [Photobacterium leiognathi]MCG3884120.1 hypothetical protein [Photobacterium leiognathi]